MNPIRPFVKRNCMIFFRDKGAVFGSMLGVIIVLMLYVLFLKDIMLQSYPAEGGEFLMNSWVMAGMVAVAAVTSALGSYEMLVHDRELGSIKLLKVSPMSPLQMAIGYILTSFIISFLLSMFTLLIAEIYIFLYGGQILSALSILKVIAIALLGTASSSAIMFFIVSFVRSSKSFTTVCVIMGTLVGFVAGAYIPIGNFPSSVQSFLSIVPVTNEASLLRQVFMDIPETEYFVGASTETVHDFQVDMGEILTFGGTDITPIISIAILLVTAVIFTLLSSWNLSRKI